MSVVVTFNTSIFKIDSCQVLKALISISLHFCTYLVEILSNLIFLTARRWPRGPRNTNDDVDNPQNFNNLVTLQWDQLSDPVTLQWQISDQTVTINWQYSDIDAMTKKWYSMTIHWNFIKYNEIQTHSEMLH